MKWAVFPIFLSMLLLLPSTGKSPVEIFPKNETSIPKLPYHHNIIQAEHKRPFTHTTIIIIAVSVIAIIATITIFVLKRIFWL